MTKNHWKVVHAMVRDIEADIFVMVDGDDTYPAEFINSLIEPVANGKADMVIGDRLSNGTYSQENKRPFHNFGNDLVRQLVNGLFDTSLHDIITGYRGFSCNFVKSMLILSQGFEIEMALHD